jgi:PAS domain S-box-containing protein
VDERDRGARGYGLAAASIVVAVALRLLLSPVIGADFPFATLFFAVLFTAGYGGFGPAFLATVLGGLASVALLLPRDYGFSGEGAVNLGGLVLYTAVSLGIAAIGGALRRAQRRAELTAGEFAAERERLRITLQSIGDAVIATDTSGCVTSMNAVAEELTGWRSREAGGRPLSEVFRIVNERSRRAVVNPVERVLAEGRIVGLANHTVLVAKDGTERPIDDSAAPIRDEDGDLVGVVLVFRDLTENRRKEALLRRSEQELNDFFENANMGLHWVGPDGIIQRVNRAELELLGYEHDEYVGRHIAEFHADRPAIDDILRRLKAGETIQDYPARLKCKDGSIRDVLINSSVLWENGVFVHTRCFTLDVTERKRAEERLRTLAAVVEGSNDFIGVCNLDMDPIFVNAAGLRMVGLDSMEEARRTKVIEFFWPEDRPLVEREAVPVLQRDGRWRGEVRFRNFKTQRPIHTIWNVTAIRNEAGEPVAWATVSPNLDALKEAEQALREADRRKDEFLAMLAHELRNPLAPVRSSIEIMKRTPDDAATVGKARSTIDRQMSHLERLVDDLLDVSRITRDRLELRPVRAELASIIHQAVETCRPLAEERQHQMTIDLPAEPIYLRADPVRLAQVFSNLLSNACKYTDRRGSISLAARLEGDRVTVAVKDSGVGIAADMLGRVFDMFAQGHGAAERVQGGLGIGLTLVRRLVEMHGGQVEAFSDGPNRGSEFVVRLPVLLDPSELAPAPPVIERSVAPRRVLIVDDNRDAAESLAMLLDIAGHATHVAHDGLAAIEAAEAFRPQVVLLDIGLPKLSGHDAARRIRQQPWGRDMLLVALTGWGQDDDRRKSMETGFDHHLVKPIDLESLNAVLAGVRDPA